MSDYLRRYVGKYRVLSSYDLNTLDYVRTAEGDIDKSIDLLYISCANHIQIKHAGGSMLWAYIPYKSKGINILRQIWADKINKPLPQENNATRRYSENLCAELVNNDILYDAEVLDSEVCFTFNAKDIEYYAKLLKAKTSGAKISPYSTRNLPKESYIIPNKDLKLYDDIIKTFPKRDMGDRQILDGLFIRKLNKEFFTKYKLTNDTRLKAKEFIHKNGLWDKYIKFLKVQEV